MGVLRESRLLEPVTEIPKQEKKSIGKERWSSFSVCLVQDVYRIQVEILSGIQELELTGDTDENMIASLDISEAYFQNCHSPHQCLSCGHSFI